MNPRPAWVAHGTPKHPRLPNKALFQKTESWGQNCSGFDKHREPGAVSLHVPLSYETSAVQKRCFCKLHSVITLCPLERVEKYLPIILI